MGNVFDPCDPEVTPEEILHDAVEGACLGWNDPVVGLYNELGNCVLLSSVFPEVSILQEVYFPTCKSSFPFTEISDAYYAQTDFFAVGQLRVNGLIPEFIFYGFSSLCIQIPKQNSFGQSFSVEDSQSLTASAFDDARLFVCDLWMHNEVNNQIECKQAFINRLITNLQTSFHVSQSSISVNQTPCNNNAQVSEYKTNVLGFCRSTKAGHNWFLN